jgi:CRISPR-associated protein Csc1
MSQQSIDQFTKEEDGRPDGAAEEEDETSHSEEDGIQIIEATLTTHGKVGFVSREVGRMSDTDPYLLNTALYYALGFASGNYVDVTQQPTYKSDTEAIAENTYITPGKPVATQDVDQNSPTQSPSIEYITTNRNARSDTYATPNFPAKDDRNEYAGLNTPSFEKERCFLPENSFRFYIFLTPESPYSVDDLPEYIRLGKDRGKCRIKYREVPYRTETGDYHISHPMSAYDYTAKPDGGVVMKKIPPLALWIEARFDSKKYISINPDSDDPVTYPHPNKLEFLRTKTQ